MTALHIEGLAKDYRGHPALRGVDLRVGAGELVGLLGPNGAGKSTLVKSVCGLVRPTRGSISVYGARAGGRESRRSIGYLAETFRYPQWATAAEVLALHQRLTASRGGDRERGELLELVGLPGHAETRIGEMSKGMQQRLGLAQSLVGSPTLLLLDEPTSALDPAGRRLVREVLDSLRTKGIAVLLNSHLLSEVELVCDRVVILRQGLVVTEGAPHDLVSPRGVEIETDQGVETIGSATRADVPRLVAERVAAGRDVFGVRVLESTLEDVYLEAVGEVAS